MKTPEEWTRLVRATNQGLTEEQITAAAHKCWVTEQLGDPCGTWHAAASVTNTSCSCARCRPDIKRFA